MDDRGGLQYNIEVGGDAQSKVDSLIASLTTLDAKFKALSQRTTASSTSKGTRSDEVAEAQKLSAVERKHLELLNKQQLALDRTLDSLRNTVKVEERQAEVRRKYVAQQDVSLRKEDLIAQAKVRQNALDEKRLFQQIQINNLVNKGVLDIQRVSELTGISATRVQQLSSYFANAAKSARATADEAKRIAAESQKAQAAVRARTTAVSSGRAAITEAEAQAAATQKITKATNELAIKKAQIDLLTKDGTLSQQEAAKMVGLTADQAQRLGINMKDANSVANQFLFTFRRLVGILAVFTLARKFAEAIGGAVREMVSFNAELETSRLSLATIISSVGEIYDGQGKMVTGAEAFNIALTKSNSLVNRLRKDAVGSIATFEGLIRAYQAGVGPGLSAGLNLDEIRNFTNAAAEGAIRLGVPVNQLNEEIRSLIQGTARARDTRLAVLFGGADVVNNTIKAAREQGKLNELLAEMANKIRAGAKASSDSYDVVKSDLSDITSLLLAMGGKGLFDELKATMKEITAAIKGTGDTDGTLFSPEALAVAQNLSGIVSEVVKAFREASDAQESMGTLGDILGILRDNVSFLAPLVANFLQSTIQAIGILLGPVRLIAVATAKISDLLGPFAPILKQVLAYVLAIKLGAFAWSKITAQVDLMMGPKGILTSLKKAWAVLMLNVAATKGQAFSLRTINVLQATWNTLLNGAAIKMAIITGGITVVAGLIASVIADMLMVDKSMAAAADDTATMADDTGIVTSNITESAESAKKMATDLKKARQELELAIRTKGLSSEAAAVAKVLNEYDITIGDINDKYNEAVNIELKKQEAAKATIQFFKEQTRALEEQLKVAAQLREQRLDKVSKNTTATPELYYDTKKIDTIVASMDGELAVLSEMQKAYKGYSAEVDKAIAAQISGNNKTAQSFMQLKTVYDSGVISAGDYYREMSNNVQAYNTLVAATKTAVQNAIPAADQKLIESKVKEKQLQEENLERLISESKLMNIKLKTQLENNRELESEKRLRQAIATLAIAETGDIKTQPIKVEIAKAELEVAKATLAVEQEKAALSAKEGQRNVKDYENRIAALQKQKTTLTDIKKIQEADKSIALYKESLALLLKENAAEKERYDTKIKTLSSGTSKEVADSVLAPYQDVINNIPELLKKGKNEAYKAEVTLAESIAKIARLRAEILPKAEGDILVSEAEVGLAKARLADLVNNSKKDVDELSKSLEVAASVLARFQLLNAIAPGQPAMQQNIKMWKERVKLLKEYLANAKATTDQQIKQTQAQVKSSESDVAQAKIRKVLLDLEKARRANFKDTGLSTQGLISEGRQLATNAPVGTLEAKLAVAQSEVDTMARSVSDKIITELELNIAKARLQIISQDSANKLDKIGRDIKNTRDAISQLDTLMLKVENVTSDNLIKRQELISEENNLVNAQSLFLKDKENREKAAQADVDAKARAAQQAADIARNDIGATFEAQFDAYKNNMPTLAESFSSALMDGMENFSSMVAGLFTSLIDPRQNTDIKTAFGEFFLGLAGSFVQAIVDQMAAKAVASLIMGPLFGNSGGAVPTGRALGGPVRGYASGGDVRSLPRPANIPASDTIPAWLTPGEYVINAGAVRNIGVGLLDALNNGVLNVDDVLPAVRQHREQRAAIRGFAKGGNVGPASRTASEGSRTIVLPVLPTTENNLEQIIAGGRSSFSSGVNKVDYVGDPNRSGKWKGT